LWPASCPRDEQVEQLLSRCNDPVHVLVRLEHRAIGASPTTAAARAAPSPVQLADHDQPGRDADPRRQRRARR
jgi:hypothetical protein